MKELLHTLAETFFETIPFSRKAEEAKQKIEEFLTEEYAAKVDENKNEIKSAGLLLSEYTSFSEAAKAAGYTQEEIKELSDLQDSLDKNTIKKLFQKLRRYIFTESLLLLIILGLVFSVICNFSSSVVWSHLCFILIFSGITILVHKRKQKFLNKTNFNYRKLDIAGCEYIKGLYDKYIKKSFNTVFLSMALLFYIAFLIIWSVLSFRCQFRDIQQLLSYHSLLLEVLLFFVLKNLKCVKSLEDFFIKKKKQHFYLALKRSVILAGVFWTAATSTLLLFRESISAIFNYYLIFFIVFLAAIFVFNFTIRKIFVFKNIVLNLKRAITVFLIVVLLFSYAVMSMDYYFTQPFINRVSFIQREADTIEYNKENGIYTIITEKETFKILQLTDIHLGGSIVSARQDIKALETCYELIKYTEPDLVVVTGDMVFPMGIMSFSLNNRAPMEQFAAFMRNTGIPWAFTYGNHDTEAMACITADEFDELMKSLSFKSSGNLLYPYIQPDIYGRSNQLIEIRHSDGTLMQALFLLDSNDYLPDASGFNVYDYIHDDQVEWYKDQVLALNKKEGKQIPSMIFFHIPLQEYRTANELYEAGSEEVTYYYGILGESMIDKICCSDIPSKLFAAAVELGSTKAMFCGHDHYNNQSLEYKGIRLTYGYSIDYLVMPGIEEDTQQRGATLITIDTKGAFTIDPCRLIDLKNK